MRHTHAVPDTLDPTARSERMSRIRRRDTRPELIVRRLLHSLGYRYRLHRRDLPGTSAACVPQGCHHRSLHFLGCLCGPRP
jgi:DNA mismatch endonuclease (patch repair protein)